MEGIPVVIFEVKSKVITLGHPHRGLLKVSLEELQQQLVKLSDLLCQEE